MLTAAVRRRLRSDVPLGAFLSGGVDSSYIVSRMVASASGPVRTFSMGTSDEAHDERRYARRVAAHCGTDAYRVRGHARMPGASCRAWCGSSASRFADAACIPTYYVAERRAGDS